MDLTRRCFLQIFGGTAVGVAFSPLPWKLLDDAAIWTQNWAWIARPPRGPVSRAYTTCTLCPAGCGLQLRRIGSHVVAATGLPGHPVSGGGVCPVGLGIAQLPFHPARLRQAVRRTTGTADSAWSPCPTDEAIADVGRRLADLRAAGRADRVAILDLRPGRALSVMHREFLERIGGGRYVVQPDGREAAAAALADLVTLAGGVPGYDLGAAGAIISFGAPLLDGWWGCGTAPGLACAADGRRPDDLPFLVQVQSNGSLETARADRWLPIRPGSEAAVALGLAHILLDEGLMAQNVDRHGMPSAEWLNDFRTLVAPYTPDRVAVTAQVEARALISTAHDLAARRPVIAVGCGSPGGGPLGREEEWAIWGLNLLLGSVGQAGGVVLRRDAARTFGDGHAVPAVALAEIPDGSLDLLLLDGSASGAALPRDLLRRKLSGPDALLVALSASATGPIGAADLILPAAAPGEWLDDIGAQALAPRNSYAWAPPLAEPTAGTHHPADLLEMLAMAAGLAVAAPAGRQRHEALLQARAATLQAGGRGEVHDPAARRSLAVGSLTAAGQLATILRRGGCWTESAAGRLAAQDLKPAAAQPPLAERFAALGEGRLPAADRDAYPLALVLVGQQGIGGGILPPVLTKLYRESHLKPGPDRAHINPDTARRGRLRDGHQARLSAPGGSLTVTIVLDEATMPGVVQMAPGPDPRALGDTGWADADRPGILEICTAARQDVWRVGRVSLKEV